jgi:toxin ParE1/3/4
MIRKVSERPAWKVRLTASAERDFSDIVAWTAGKFGADQARRYAGTLVEALEALTEGPSLPGIRKRDEIRQGLMSLHIARGDRKGRHFLIFRANGDTDDSTIEVLRILHDAMDIEGNLPEG